jgi:hypothetical protein
MRRYPSDAYPDSVERGTAAILRREEAARTRELTDLADDPEGYCREDDMFDCPFHAAQA